MNMVKPYYNFHNGLKDMIKISPIISDIMYGQNKTLPNTHEEATIKVLKALEKNPPTFRQYLPSAHAINISKDGLSMKLNGQLSFGWTIERRYNNIVYHFRVSINSNNPGIYQSRELNTAKNLKFRITDSKYIEKKYRRENDF